MASREDHAKTSTARNRKKIRPLERETILVTRPLSQSGEITQLLQESGAVVAHCATIEIAPPSDWEALDHAIAKLETYDWLVFTSANGVKFFFDRLIERRGPTFQLAAKQCVCAIGPATAKTIQLTGAGVDLLVTESRSEGVLREIVERVAGKGAIRGLSFLLPASRQAREFLPIELRRLGAHVDAVEAYQTLKPNVDIGSLFGLQNIGVITFTSPSTVSNFVKLVDDSLFAVLRAETLVACIGPLTTAAAVEHGFKRIVQADAPNPRALVEAIARSVADNKG